MLAVAAALQRRGRIPLFDGFLPHGARLFGIQRQIELLFPVEGGAGVRNRVVLLHGARNMLRDVRHMGRDLVGDDALMDVFGVRQADVLLRRDVAQHGGAVPCADGRADGARDVVVTGGAVHRHRAENVERRVVAPQLLKLHVHLDFVQRNMAGAFDHDLHIGVTATLGEFAKLRQFSKLRTVGRIRQTARAETVAKRNRHIVLAADLQNIVEIIIERIVVSGLRHVPCDERAAAGDDAHLARTGGGQHGRTDAAMHRHVIDALLRLVADDGQDGLLRKIDGVVAAAAAGQFIDRDGSDGNDGMADDRAARLVQIVAGRKIHDGVRAIGDGGVQLLEFQRHAAGGRRRADVRVDLRLQFAADAHGLQACVQLVGGHDDAAVGDTFANPFRVTAFVFRHGGHFIRDNAALRGFHLVQFFHFPHAPTKKTGARMSEYRSLGMRMSPYADITQIRFTGLISAADIRPQHPGIGPMR